MIDYAAIVDYDVYEFIELISWLQVRYDSIDSIDTDCFDRLDDYFVYDGILFLFLILDSDLLKEVYDDILCSIIK